MNANGFATENTHTQISLVTMNDYDDRKVWPKKWKELISKPKTISIESLIKIDFFLSSKMYAMRFFLFIGLFDDDDCQNETAIGDLIN